MTAIHILIVEDNPALLETLPDALRRRLDIAYIDRSDSIQDALNQVAEREYDALVVDIDMAGTNGPDLLEEINQHQADIPILLIADPANHELAVKALRGGAYDYVTKPIDEEYFVASLRHAIEYRRRSRDLAAKRQDLLRHTEDLEAFLQEHALQLREALHREQVARAELDLAKRRLEDLTHQRESFVASVAHDLATPLTTIQGYAELLGRSAASPERQQRACAVIVSEAGRLVRLVKDLADAAQRTIGQFRTEFVLGDLAQITREQVELARALTREHTIVLDAPPALPIVGDPDRLARLLSNLLSNAVKHTSGGEIEVRLKQDGRQVLLSVRDSGPGMPRDLANAISTSRGRVAKREHRSPGLGLQIVRGIAEAHGGRIWVETTDGQGSTFRVALPVVKIGPSNIQDRQDGENC